MAIQEKLHLYLSTSEIDAINTELASRITQDYSEALEPGTELLVVVTLKGAMYFAADLVRKINIPLRVDYIRASSYGSAKESSREVKVLRDLDSNLTNQHVLVLDEIVDTGHTLSHLLSRFAAEKPASLKVCALLDKASCREVEVPVDYGGKTVENKFLVGYGLDFDEQYRNLSEIYYI